MKSLPTWLLVLALTACGGDGAPAVAEEIYQGTVSGTNCFDSFPQTSQVAYAVSRGTAEGSAVNLVDASGTAWTGAMTSPTSFRVTSATADPRMSITVTDITSSTAGVVATTSCVSFRCCTPMAGVLQVTHP